MMRCFAAIFSTTHSAAASGEPILIIISIAFSLAPPCSGPLSVPTEEVIAEWRFASVPAVTRPEKVEALKPWSASRMR